MSDTHCKAKAKNRAGGRCLPSPPGHGSLRPKPQTRQWVGMAVAQPGAAAGLGYAHGYGGGMLKRQPISKQRAFSLHISSAQQNPQTVVPNQHLAPYTDST